MENFRSVTLLNTTGDITLTWEPEKDDIMREMIEQKMNEGYAFFIIEPRSNFIKLLGNKRTYINKFDDIKSREVTLEMDEAEYLSSLESKNQVPKISIDQNDSNETNKVKDSNVINLGDKRAEKLAKEGHIAVANVPATNYDTVKKATTVDEVVSNHTVAFPKIAGG